MKNLSDVLINDINNKSFYFLIPSYQRGYRWTKTEVRKLLDDLFEFYELKEKKNQLVGDYYCLQPITFKRRPSEEPYNRLEIVDGQQRLTTIYLILKLISRFPDHVFRLLFERDIKNNNSRQRFLEGLMPDCIPEPQTVDEYYFRDAFIEIKNWFDEKERTIGNVIYNNMEKMILSYTKIILYELEADKDCYTVFKNLNKGKIPLTDAELVKAMLLNSRNFYENGNNVVIEQKQNYYARFWDEMQKNLYDNSVWAFITAGTDVDIPNHIDLLFQLDVKRKGIELENHDNQDYKLFNIYEDNLHNSEDKEKYVNSVFDDIRKLFRTIQGWFSDPVLYNFIGYKMTYEGKTKNNVLSVLNSLIEKYENQDHNDFLYNSLLPSILQPFSKKEISTINYLDDRNKVEKALMLFNIFELNEMDRKFDFDKCDSFWTIEHINAQQSKVVEEKPEIWIDYLEKEKIKIGLIEKNTNNTYEDLRNDILMLLSKISTMTNYDDSIKNEFINLANKINKEVDGFSETDEHQLGNLALILNCDNIVLSNNPFYEKRNKVFQWLEEKGKNIPYATAKAFQKMYSPQDYNSNYIQWKKTDCEAMFKRQSELFIKYFNKISPEK